MNYKGFYINLKENTERNRSLVKHLKDNNLHLKFERFEAIKPKDCDDIGGLKSKGEYGLWLSFISLLDKITKDNGDGFVLIIEDDFRFKKESIYILDTILKTSRNINHQIYFLDYLIDNNLIDLHLRHFKKNEYSDKKLFFYSAATNYIGCTSCLLIRQSSSKYLLDTLKNFFQKLKHEKKLKPIDMVLRVCLQNSIIKGSIIVPPIGAPDWYFDHNSTIQTNHDLFIRNSMKAYLLLRIAASGIKDVKFCALEFSKLTKTYINIDHINNLEDFYKLFKSNLNKISHNW